MLNSYILKFRHTLFAVLGVTISTFAPLIIQAPVLAQRFPDFWMASMLSSQKPVSPAKITYIRLNKTIRLGGYYYGGWQGNHGQMSPSQVNWVANNLDLFSAPSVSPEISGISLEQLKYIRQINPGFKFFIMSFATTLYEPEFNPKTMSSWVLRLKNNDEAIGIRRKTPNSTAHIMDMGSLEWANFYRTHLANKVNTYAADGVIIDEVMWNGYWGVNVKNLQNYTSLSEIQSTAYLWLSRITHPHLFKVMHQAFWDEAQANTDGIWGELAFNYLDDDEHQRNVFYRAMNWSEIVDNLSKHSSQERPYIWAAWYPQDDEKKLEYAVATYLIAKKSNSAIFQAQPIYQGGYPKNLAGYSLQTAIQEYNNHKALFDIEIGSSLKNAVKVSTQKGVYWQRSYQRGLVLCNPSSKIFTIGLRDNYVDINDNPVNKFIVLEPRSGAILIRQ